MKLIIEHAPKAVKEQEMKHYFGRKLAIDASMCIYQFLIAGCQAQEQQSATGEPTSHLTGMFYRTVRMLEHGIKPCFVFDGIPPEMKGGEVSERVSLLL